MTLDLRDGLQGLFEGFLGRLLLLLPLAVLPSLVGKGVRKRGPWVRVKYLL